MSETVFPHTDLACERLAADVTLEGVEHTEEERRGCRISRLSVRSREGAEAIGKPEGSYVTMSFPPLYELHEGELAPLAETLSELILEFCDKLPKKPRSVLAVGLGNRAMTADAVGPESIRAMTATRHLRIEDPDLFDKYAEAELSLLAPGVMGETGIEAVELVAGAVRAAAPELVIAVDALAARSVTRLATTVQLSDTGIRPGSGVGNSRRAIDRETLGVPVLAIGIPTVVSSHTLVYDAFRQAGLADGEIPGRLREVLSEGVSFFVSPRESDTVTERAAQLVANAVNASFSAGFFAEG